MVEVMNFENVNSEFGPSDQQWVDMLEGAEDKGTPQEIPPSSAPVVEPVAAPQVTPTIPATPPIITPASTETTGNLVGELLELLPEKFKGKEKDLKKAVERMINSYREVETSNTQKGQELSAAVDMLRQFQQKYGTGALLSEPFRKTNVPSGQTEQPSAALESLDPKEIQEIIDSVTKMPDQQYYESPVQSTGRIAAQAAMAIAERIAAREKGRINMDDITKQVSDQVSAKMALAEVQRLDPDGFNIHGPELHQVLAEKPWMNTASLIPTAYAEAKSRMQQRFKTLREQMGVTDTESMSALVEKQVEERVNARVNELLNKGNLAQDVRATASGLPTGGTGGGATEVRINTPPPAKTPEQQLQDAIAGLAQQHELFSPNPMIDPTKR